MVQDVKNPLEDLTELLVNNPSELSANYDGEFFLDIDLRVSMPDIPLENDVVAKICVKKIWIKIDLLGLEISPGSRLGERTVLKEIEQITVNNTKHTTQNGVKLGVSLSKTDKGNYSFGVNSNSDKSKSQEKSEKYTEIRNLISARSGNKWEVSSVTDDYLDYTILDNEPLCILRGKTGSNMKEISIYTIIRSHDIDFKLNHKSLQKKAMACFTRNENKQKILNAIAAKSINDLSISSEAGMFVTSKTTVE